MSSSTLADPGKYLDHTSVPPLTKEKGQSSIHDRNGVDGLSISWREIFKTTAGWPPTLGLDFLRAAQHTTTTTYELEGACGGEGPGKDSGRNNEEAKLTLGQDLGKLGLGAVVWDCVSYEHVNCFFRFSSSYVKHEEGCRLLPTPTRVCTNIIQGCSTVLVLVFSIGTNRWPRTYFAVQQDTVLCDTIAANYYGIRFQCTPKYTARKC